MAIEVKPDRESDLTNAMALFSNDELASIHRAVVSLVSALDSAEVVDRLVAGALRILDGDFAYLLVHRGGGELALVNHRKLERAAQRDTNAEQLFARGRAMLAESEAERRASLAGGDPLPQGLIYVPIRGTKGKGVAAVLCVGSYERKFGAKEFDALMLLTRPASLVLDNVRLYERSKEFSRRLKLQTDIQRALTTVSLDRAFPPFAKALREVINFDLALLLSYDKPSKAFIVNNVWTPKGEIDLLDRRIAAEDSFLARELGKSAATLVHKLPEGGEPEDLRWLSQAAMGSGVVVRLLSKHTSIGIFSLWSRTRAFYDSSQMELLRWLARQLAMALENHRLFLQLERAKHEWEATFDAMTDAVWITDEAFRVRRYNLAFQKALGNDHGQILGTSTAALLNISPETLAPNPDRGNERFRLELRQTRLGEVVEVLGTRLVSDKVSDGGIVFVARDVGEVKRDMSRFEQVDRLVALGQLAAAMAHEITNPLSYVKSNLHFVRDRVFQDEPDDEARAQLPEVTDEIMEGVDRIQGVVEKLQMFARGWQQGPTRFSLNELMDSCLTLVWALLRPRTQVVTHFGDLPEYTADQGRLTQVMVNLLVKAAQSMNPKTANTNILEVFTKYNEGWYSVRIQPRGAGEATPGQREFEPYFVGEQDLYGTGLGLEISIGIVRDMGGEVIRDRTPGGEDAFTVHLPEEGRRAPPAGTPTRRSLERRPGKMRVLVVDDEQFVRRAMVRILSRVYEVSTARDLRQALEVLEGDARFDVILCDVIMPGGSGIDLFNEIKERWPRLESAVVFVTGAVFNSEMEGTLGRGPNRVLRKPVEPHDLVAAVETVAHRRKAQ